VGDTKAGRIDQELVRALSHPVRVGILETLQGRIASPRELSREMDQSLGVVAYHANTLVKCGCLELVETKPRRGAVEHFFGITPRSLIGHQDWRRAPATVRAGITNAAIQTFFEAAKNALDSGTIDAREDTTLNWMPLTVDDAGWREIASIMDRASQSLTEAHVRAAQRLGNGEGISVIVGLAAFEAGKRRAPEGENGTG
jgi:Helix-turn-helix domain